MVCPIRNTEKINYENNKTMKAETQKLIMITLSAILCSLLIATCLEEVFACISVLFSIIVVLLPVILYMTPTIIAMCRSHPNSVPIFIINLLLGWTGVGWIGALAWSCTSKQ
jgi:hypothetical protein